MMPSGLFEGYVARMEPLRAERLLDAATAATAQFQKQSWWDRLAASARGVAAEAVRRFPMFTWNGAAINTSQGLRQRFSESVTGATVGR